MLLLHVAGLDAGGGRDDHGAGLEVYLCFQVVALEAFNEGHQMGFGGLLVLRYTVMVIVFLTGV